MSDTDKTRPYWVRVRDDLENTIEHHDHSAGDCDYQEWLENPKRRRYWNWFNTCGRSFSSNTDYYYGQSVPKWYVDHTWNNPERVRVRDVLNKAKQWYNGGDDLEDFDFPNEQHRHRSSWYWW
jgi:hypothetical protein